MDGKTRHRPSLAAILALAKRQHGVVTRAQLLDAGLSRQAIEHRRKTGRLHRIHRSVYAVGRPELRREGWWLAAVMACGEGAALSYLCAGGLWGIWERAVPSRPQVSVPSRHGRRGHPGIELHRTTLDPDEVTVRLGIPVTTLTRTIIDLAGILDIKHLRSVLRQAERQHRLDLRRLRSFLDEGVPRTSGKHGRLRRALDTYVPGAAGTEADVEMVFLELCARHGIPAPETQAEVGPYRADFMWPDLKLVVEIDDRQSHDGHIAFQEDRVRDRTMRRAGLDVLRFTRTEVLRDPAGVAREVKSSV